MLLPPLSPPPASQLMDFLPELVTTLKQEGYLLTESEANILLPCLVEKVRPAALQWKSSCAELGMLRYQPLCSRAHCSATQQVPPLGRGAGGGSRRAHSAVLQMGRCTVAAALLLCYLLRSLDLHIPKDLCTHPLLGSDPCSLYPSSFLFFHPPFTPLSPFQSGHNIHNVREKFREVFRLLVFVYPASRVLHAVVDGLKSKNYKTRIECVELLEEMIERHGIEVRGGGREERGEGKSTEEV